MIKMVYSINRLPHLSVEEFQRYWFNTHGPIAGAIKGVKRYYQCHTLPETYSGDQEPPFDGCAQLWWESEETLAADIGTTESLAAITDEREFIDHSRVSIFMSDEKIVFDKLDGKPGMKLIALLKRKEGTTREKFEEYWGGIHADLGRKVPGLLKYARCLKTADLEGVEGLGPSEFDGAAELYFNDLGSLQKGLASPEMRAAIDDLPNFTSGEAASFITQEKVIVG